MASVFVDFLKNQWQTLPIPTTSFEGQTVIVTGSNTGLGLETARHFASLNAAKVILACRSIPKGEAAADSIHTSTGRSNICEVWELDMANYASIKAFAKRAEGLERLDVVIENAGISKSVFAEAEGTEATIAVNVIGTFLLALLLLPVLRRSAVATGVVPRLVVVSSDIHSMARFNERLSPSIFTALADPKSPNMMDRYPTSKLLDILIVRSLAAAVTSSPSTPKIIINTPSPGLCHSELMRDAQGLAYYALNGMKALFARTTEVGSRNFIAAACAGPDSHGQYISECVVKEPSAFVRGREGEVTQQRVWDELMGILEGIQPGIGKNI